jgi:molybdate transport system substrate-binding protein
MPARRLARAPLATLAALAGLAVLAAAAPATAAGRSDPGSAPSGSVTVSAAASLSEAFNRLGADFRRRYPRVGVAFNFDASSTLATQIQQGAPADVFASADLANMDRLVRAGMIAGRPVVFAQNLLEVAVAPGNPKRIRTLADTLKPGVSLVLCAPQVPCGTFARQAYQRAGLHLGSVPTGLNVKDTLSKVTLGEADAAVVYVTDVRAARGKAKGVLIPPAQNVRAVYPIGVVRGTAHPAAATAFVAYVRSSAGLATLRRFGFLAP